MYPSGKYGPVRPLEDKPRYELTTRPPDSEKEAVPDRGLASRVMGRIEPVLIVLKPRMRLAADLLRFALRRIYRNRKRYRGAVLTSALGIAGLITALTLGDAVETRVGHDLELLGSATIIEATWDYDRSIRWHHGNYSQKDVEDLRRLPGVVEVAPVLWDWKGHVAHKKNKTTARIAGVDGSYFRAVALNVALGRQINQQDNDVGRAVCTVGKETAQELFGGRKEALGQALMIQGIPFEVVGVLAWNLDPLYERTVVIPFSLAQRRIKGMDVIRHVRVRAKDWEAVPALADQVREVLKRNKSGYEDAISIFWYKDRIGHIKNIAFLVHFFALAFVAVALVLGAISIYNLMNAVVSERTREIGLSLAIGAMARTVMFQFLCESVIVSVLGAGLGILCGFAAVQLGWGALGTMRDYSTFIFSLQASVIVGILLGVASGLLPAKRASGFSCVDAMRFE